MGNMIRKIVLAVLTLLLIHQISAFPTPPCQYSGTVIVDGEYALQGTRISMIDKEDNLCGTTEVGNLGYYILSCRGDDPDTEKDEGAKEGEEVRILIDGKETKEKVIWESERFVQLHLTNESWMIEADVIEHPSEPSRSVDPEIVILLFMFSILLAFIIIKMKNISKGNKPEKE